MTPGNRPSCAMLNSLCGAVRWMACSRKTALASEREVPNLAAWRPTREWPCVARAARKPVTVLSFFAGQSEQLEADCLPRFSEVRDHERDKRSAKPFPGVHALGGVVQWDPGANAIHGAKVARAPLY